MGKRFTEYSQFDLSQVNKDVLKKWDENQVFAKSMTERDGCPSFVFFEGPPSANGLSLIHISYPCNQRYGDYNGFHRTFFTQRKSSIRNFMSCAFRVFGNKRKAGGRSGGSGYAACNRSDTGYYMTGNEC